MKIKKQKGVTLTILVVTIALILIIAGSSLSVIFDEEGLLNTSKEVKNIQQSYANAEEQKTDNLIEKVNDIQEGYANSGT